MLLLLFLLCAYILKVNLLPKSVAIWSLKGRASHVSWSQASWPDSGHIRVNLVVPKIDRHVSVNNLREFVRPVGKLPIHSTCLHSTDQWDASAGIYYVLTWHFPTPLVYQGSGQSTIYFELRSGVIEPLLDKRSREFEKAHVLPLAVPFKNWKWWCRIEYQEDSF